ncbi:hypothetical protein AX14_008291 [Amanita brunnescens Koide BX004]|nr:hypothetical protein AX14_008291 [Amanita brunnescens Koide BX004]
MAELSQDEEGFKTHIRTLLCRYAEAYLTCDHRQWTEKAVVELLAESLHIVPIVDPTSLYILPEPFDALQQLYNLSQLSPYEEQLLTNASALVYVKDTLSKLRREIGSGGAALVDDPNPPVCQRMEEAVLTTRAIRSTPRLPSGAMSAIVQKGPFYLPEGTKLVGNEDPDQTPLQSDEILNVNWQMSTSECRQEVQAMCKRVLDLSGRVPSHLQAQLDTDEFNIQSHRPDSPFIPLFPRNASSARKKGPTADKGSKLNSLAELPAYLPPRISTEELDKDLFNYDMRIIDDWGSFTISSPSTLSSPSSSQVDRRIDMLFKGSSPNTVPDPTEALEAAKMDIVQIPRSRRPGGANIGKSIADDDCFASFVLKTVHGTKEPIASEVGTQACLQQISSIAGEPPCSATQVASMVVDEVDTDDDISKLYARERVKNFWSWETLDEKDTMLMEGKTCLRA